MSLVDFIRIIIKNLRWLVLFPLTLALVVFFFTRNEKKEYVSNCLMYTGLASGVSIMSTEETRVDYFAVNNAFDNLIATVKARETIEEVALRLLAQHLMLNQPKAELLSSGGFRELQEIIPARLRDKLVDKYSLENTVGNIVRYKNAHYKNEIISLLNSDNPTYGIASITRNMTVARKQSSDMLDLSFKGNDPGVTQQTLVTLANVFMSRYKRNKGSETESVVGYFADQTSKTFGKLKGAEDELRDFGIKNKIINYDEQTKYIAEAKEELEKEIYREKMEIESAEAALKRLEEKIGSRSMVLMNTQKLMEKRSELSSANFLLANARIANENPQEIAKLVSKTEQLKEEIRRLVDEYFRLNNTIESVPRQNLLNQWLDNILNLDESKAKMRVIEKRKIEFDGIYNQFAPLGSTLNRLNRNVDIIEKEYLQLLHGLNMAQLRQQNIELSSNLKMVDAPFFPQKPEPSKRPLLIVVSFIGGFVLALGFFVTVEFLDNTLKSITRAEQATGLNMLGALPLIDPSEKLIDLDYLEAALIEHSLSSIKIEFGKVDNPQPYNLLLLFSTKTEVGKTWVGSKLFNKFSDIMDGVYFIHPITVNNYKNYRDIERVSNNDISYVIHTNFVDYASLSDFLPDDHPGLINPKLIILELPALIDNPIPVQIVRQATHSVLIAAANKVWTDSDNHSLNLFRKATNNNISLFLNVVAPYKLESVFGEVPKKRSRLRRIIKKILTLSFNEKSYTLS